MIKEGEGQYRSPFRGFPYVLGQTLTKEETGEQGVYCCIGTDVVEYFMMNKTNAVIIELEPQEGCQVKINSETQLIGDVKVVRETTPEELLKHETL